MAETLSEREKLPAMPSPLRLGDRYEIHHELGRGGMGCVYAARDLRLARNVAVKVLSGAHSELALARFEHEARAAGSLNHPNVLSVFDVGAGELGPYIVSELLEGKTLRAALRNGALPLRTALDLAAQLAKGLAAAHEKGIVHRDLKPENLFVTTEGRVKILDFGIAKLQGAGDRALPSTETGTILGTMGYMAPEQVRGEHADARSDIFSFGAIVHEMLGGRMAFERATAMAVS